MINIASPRQSYLCPACEQIHCLGESDCDGLPIGWIEHDGTPFVSRRERDVIIGSAALREAVLFWGKTGGLLGDLDDPDQILWRNGLLLENFDEAMEEFDSDVNILTSLWQEAAREQAANN